jgi:hypothetical protein
MNHPLQCQCGTLKGFVTNPRSASRVICYCKDCQAFAHFLGRPDEILDERAGSDVIQILPKDLTFTQGIDALACLRLKHKGLLRWYTNCCNTPIGNTLATPKISFVGLVHTCLENPDKPLRDSFGPVRVWVNSNSAKGFPKPKDKGQATIALWFVTKVLRARMNGDYKHTPLFQADLRTPIAKPRLLSSEEHANVMKAVRAASGP